MKYPKYEYSTEDQLFYYQFVSVGPKGNIKKVVEFSKTTVENVYNLAFGDYDENSGKIDDKTITNNGDSLKVLATVASTVYSFTTKYPDGWVFATGSTTVRTRLYRMGLTNNLAEISVDFNVYGLKADIWEEFLIGEDYEAFMITRK
ncbi:MAG: hypothetical protein M3Q58_10875 [Bacteroidota bacterium]|nr:hypothetical protein [Bacteroidota bacterium]